MMGAPISAAAAETIPAPPALTRSAPAGSASAPSTSVHAAQLMTASGAICGTVRRTRRASVTSRSAISSATTSWFTNSAARTTSRPSIPPAPVTRIRMRYRMAAGLENRDLGVVAHHEAVRARLRRAARDAHVPPNQAGLEPPLEVVDRRTLHHDRVLELGPVDRDVLGDCRIEPDVGVRDPRPATDARGSPDGGSLERDSRLDHHAPLHAGFDQLALDPLVEIVQDQPVGVEHVLHLAGVLPPAAHDVRVDRHTGVDQVLDRVGYLELSAPRRLDRTRRLEDRRGEHVD